MPKQLREKDKRMEECGVRKIHLKYLKKKGRRVKIRYLVAAITLLSLTLPQPQTQAESCPDVRVVFARGSGGERWVDKNYLEYKSTIETKLATTSLKYEFIDLDYPAVGVGMDNLDVTIGAYVGAGDTYEFGDSVNTGVKNLVKMVNSARCPDTKYVVGGYSQGAMVVSKALGSLNADRIIYAATFGDPKIYLPEGKGLIPAACRGENLSDYRMYVPDCQAYKGLLGAYIPYEPEALIGKVGTWCNRRDIFCSSRFNMSDHTSYISEALYEDASRVIFDKITKAFGLENHISSLHDTAFLIDSTGSMAGLIDSYKAEALRLATETLNSGGRVALYDYRDLDDPYTPVEHCNFETCTLEVFESELANIQASGGGDDPESLLSASFHTMKSLKWKHGATKSLVILTDADFLAPDRDGMTFDEVVRLSKTIDPVNFYIITTPEYKNYYIDLAERTDGLVITNLNELNLLTDYIIERYDSLPRVEEDNEPLVQPNLEIKAIESVDDGVKVKFETSGMRTLVVLNDMILGITEKNEITINGLDAVAENVLNLVPLGEDIRGEGVEINLAGYGGVLKHDANTNDSDISMTMNSVEVILPKTPNTGRH